MLISNIYDYFGYFTRITLSFELFSGNIVENEYFLLFTTKEKKIHIFFFLIHVLTKEANLIFKLLTTNQ